MLMNPLVKFSPVISMCSFELSRICALRLTLADTRSYHLLSLILLLSFGLKKKELGTAIKAFAQLCGLQLLGKPLVRWSFIWMCCAQRVYLDCPALQRNPISISKLTSSLKYGSCHDFET